MAHSANLVTHAFGTARTATVSTLKTRAAEVREAFAHVGADRAKRTARPKNCEFRNQLTVICNGAGCKTRHLADGPRANVVMRAH